MSHPLAVLIALLALSAASLFGALVIGTFPISAAQVIESLALPVPGIVHDVIWRLRAPRAAAAFACGGSLALAGALLHVRPGKTASTGRSALPGAAAIWSIAAAGALLGGTCATLVQVAMLSNTTAVALAVTFGLVGLIAARVLRSLAIVRRRWVFPCAFLLGGCALTLADAMTR